MASVEVPIVEAFPWLLPHPRLPGTLAAHLCQHWDPSVRVEMWPAIYISADPAGGVCVCGGHICPAGHIWHCLETFCLDS